MEVKCAQLKWDRSNRIWELRFSNIKLGYAGKAPKSTLPQPRDFDELLLAMYTPRGVIVYRHDLLFGVTAAGKRTASAGHVIKLCGPRGQEEWARALDETLLRALDRSGCERIAEVRWQRGVAWDVDSPASPSASAGDDATGTIDHLLR